MDSIEAVKRTRQTDPWTRRRPAPGTLLARLSGVQQVGKALDAGDAATLNGRQDRVELSPAAWAMLTRLGPDEPSPSLLPETHP